MKIVYLHQYFRTPDEQGGVRSYHMAKALAERGHDVHVVTARQPRSQRDRQVDRTVIGDVTVHALPVAYSNAMSLRQRTVAFATFAARSCILSRRLRGDVVIATSTPLTIAIPGVFGSWGRHCPLIFEVRDLWPDVPIAMGALSSPVVRRLGRGLERFAYRHSSRIVALSDDMRAGVVRAGYPADKITVIPNMADTQAFAPSRSRPDRWLSAHPRLQGRPLAVYAGTFGRVNDVGWMIDLAIELRDGQSPLVLVAIGDGAESDQIRDRASRAGVLGEHLIMVDPVSKSELPDVLGASTVVLSLVADVPALWGNSANKFFDALAAERPIAMNYGGWQADLLERSGAGLRLSRNASDAAAQLMRFVSTPSLMERASEAARRLAHEEFAIDYLTAVFCDTVEESVEKKVDTT